MPPMHPQIYHITHVDNLPLIIEDGCLRSDAMILQQKKNTQVVGMSHIKRRRLEELKVTCPPNAFVGEFVPFYFCARSVMLYTIYIEHPDLAYKGGQEPIVHLQFDLRSVLKWADSNNIHWAFSDRNAGAKLADFFSDWQNLDKIDWKSVGARRWSGLNIDPIVKERKQAEFLVFEQIPFYLVRVIGVLNDTIRVQVEEYLKISSHRPPVRTIPSWYY